MLKHLHIEHYALIDQLDIDFQSGFSVITGQTGAGKSIILGALSLAMGARSDAKSISQGATKCIIEAEFDQGIVRREIYANGKSRSFVDDNIVTAAELKTLASQLIDIHSQHENLLIANDDFQLSIIDAIAQNQAQRSAYTLAYETYCKTLQALHELEQTASRAQQDEDYLRYQYTQLCEANLTQTDEMEQLDEELYRLSHAEEIRSNLSIALAALDNEGQGALSLLTTAKHLTMGEIQQRLDSAAIEIKDLVREIEHEIDNIELDPQRLALVEERIDLLQTLMRKHNVPSIHELIAIRDQAARALEQTDHMEEKIASLRQNLQIMLSDLQTAGKHLTDSRIAVRSSISQQLISDMNRLGVAHANVDIEITPLTDYTASGHDNVQFLFAANLNQSLRRVSEVASGGEISRLMLCIKALVASTNGLPTILFDEIDTGVSGEIATQMGHIMLQMAASRQIIAITHLPQIAAQGQCHFCVYKQDTDSHTQTNIRQLKPEERVQEIASMLAGNQVSDAVLTTAQQLLNHQSIISSFHH